MKMNLLLAMLLIITSFFIGSTYAMYPVVHRGDMKATDIFFSKFSDYDNCENYNKIKFYVSSLFSKYKEKDPELYKKLILRETCFQYERFIGLGKEINGNNFLLSIESDLNSEYSIKNIKENYKGIEKKVSKEISCLLDKKDLFMLPVTTPFPGRDLPKPYFLIDKFKLGEGLVKGKSVFTKISGLEKEANYIFEKLQREEGKLCFFNTLKNVFETKIIGNLDICKKVFNSCSNSFNNTKKRHLLCHEKIVDKKTILDIQEDLKRFLTDFSYIGFKDEYRKSYEMSHYKRMICFNRAYKMKKYRKQPQELSLKDLFELRARAILLIFDDKSQQDFVINNNGIVNSEKRNLVAPTRELPKLPTDLVTPTRQLPQRPKYKLASAPEYENVPFLNRSNEKLSQLQTNKLASAPEYESDCESDIEDLGSTLESNKTNIEVYQNLKKDNVQKNRGMFSSILLNIKSKSLSILSFPRDMASFMKSSSGLNSD